MGPRAKQTQFSDLSDVSSTCPSKKREDQYDPEKKAPENFSMGGGSRFLKKTSRDAGGDDARTPAGTNTVGFIPQRSSRSAALNRLSVIENRIRNQNVRPGVQIDPQDTRSSLQSSSDASVTGRHFLKTKIPPEPQEEKVPQKTRLDVVIPGVNERKGRTFSPDSDEQDMPRLLGDSFSLSEDIMQSPQQVDKVNKVKHSLNLTLFQ